MGVMSKILPILDALNESKYTYPVTMGVALAIGILWANTWDLEDDPVEEPVYELRAMTNRNKLCRACIYLSRVCPRGEKECSYAILRWIVDLLDSANESIDAAIYLMTCEAFREAFLRAHERGVMIRYIADGTMANGTGSAIPAMRAAGIDVRASPVSERHMMHRKSVIVDRKWVLSGTGNWTMQSLTGNWDGFVKTNDPVAVRAMVDAFEDEWAVYDPEPVNEEQQNHVPD